MFKLINVIPIFIISLSVSKVSCSDGDRSPFYQNCVTKCLKSNCTSDGEFTPEAAVHQDIWDWLLLWDCMDECRYDCMWFTVQGFETRSYQIPKFHGKWPFKKILGVQEPASAFSSVLNLITHVYMYNKIKKEFPIKHCSMATFWHFFCWVCITSWVWSTIFHTRDFIFTEFMDYACAFSMVLSLLIAAIARICHKKATFLGMVLILLLTLYYAEHVRYLYAGAIDYDYNMKTNVLFGGLGSALWLSWACYQYRSGRRYVLNLVAFTLLSGVLLTMEVFDFPPLHGWDAHALWHLSTAYLPLLFYKFVIDDLRYLSSPRVDLKLP